MKKGFNMSGPSGRGMEEVPSAFRKGGARRTNMQDLAPILNPALLGGAGNALTGTSTLMAKTSLAHNILSGSAPGGPNWLSSQGLTPFRPHDAAAKSNRAAFNAFFGPNKFGMSRVPRSDFPQNAVNPNTGETFAPIS